MDASASASEHQRIEEPRLRAPKLSKTCVSCRARKVKCDAAVVGLPCSSCTSRHCTEGCVLPARKRRTRKVRAFSTPDESSGSRGDSTGTAVASNTGHLNCPDQSSQSAGSCRQNTPDSVDYQSPRQPPNLLYLNILHDVVKEDAELSQHGTTCNTPSSSRPEDSFTPRNRLWNKPPHLDDIDNEFLARKDVFELPPQHHLDALIKTYFDYVYPLAPVIDRTDFIQSYRSGDCSLFLLRAMLTMASIHASADVISGCGFDTRSAAQTSFFQKAKLLHDFQCESNPLLMLQGSIILGIVILDHPIDRDTGYWFHNCIRLAAKLDIRNTCIREDKSCRFLKLYRRIWWVLNFWDILHALINPRYSRLLENGSCIKSITETDWEAEDVSGTSDLLSPITPQQKASLIAYSELAQIFGQCLSIITNEPEQDPRQLMRQLDTWRKSLAHKMHIGENISHGTDVYYLDVQVTSYRFESTLCRLLRRSRRWQSRHVDWNEWAKQRLRSAILELDTIAKRVLANGTIQDFSTCFVTTMPMLLALHIESALDPAETDLVRSMARISINQLMLVLAQGQDIPSLKRALPVFDKILWKKNLYLVPLNSPDQALAQSQSHSMADMYASPHTQASVVSSQLGQSEDPSFDMDFLGFDFLNGWQTEQLDFTGRY